MHTIVQEIRAEADPANGEGAWAGVADAELCGRCRHRSICPASVTPAQPVWPVVDDVDDVDDPTP